MTDVIKKDKHVICEHGKRKTLCRPCGGHSSCEHGKRKSLCKECGGASLCEHGRQKNICKECGGKYICEHGRQRKQCRDCNGSIFCDHGKRKNLCKVCGGNSLCEHGVQKNVCKPCGGSSICEHNNIKSRCKQCGGVSICEHGRYRSVCKDCRGGNICIHNKRRALCKECGGSAFCEHGKQKHRCKICHGSGICDHGKERTRCKNCDGRDLCKSPWCEVRSQSKFDGYCLLCYVHTNPDTPITRNYKTKERDVVDRVKESFPNFDWVHDKAIKDGCSSKRPDLLLDMGSHVIIVEIDENKHSGYSCETKRLVQLSQDINERPMVMIRFNPDGYEDENGNKIKTCWITNNKTKLLYVPKTREEEWSNRIKALKEKIQYYTDNAVTKMITVEELFY